MPPSPTGHLHIGTARTALFNYLFAKKHGGKMILRSEDTDKARSTKAYETEIVEGLKWLGITWDNEEIFRQSERTPLYRGYLEKMIAAGTAYLSKEPKKDDPTTLIEVVRLKNPNKTITFTDLVRGEITFDTTELGDIVIARTIDDPLYHLTVVVDDFEMGVTHVIRGEDHIANTPRQILIQEAIKAPLPAYAHLPLILASDRSKMSKRHGAVALLEYQNAGFLPAAITNYLALLGWNPGTEQEIFTPEALVEAFSLEGVQKGGAVFDLHKFTWVNKQHLALLSDAEFTQYVMEHGGNSLRELPQFTDAAWQRLLPTIRERISLGKEFADAVAAGEYDFAFSKVQPSRELLKWKNDNKPEDAVPRLLEVASLLEAADFSSPDTIKAALWDYAEKVGKGEVLWPLRVSVTALERSPDPFTALFIVGKEEGLLRIHNTVDILKSHS